MLAKTISGSIVLQLGLLERSLFDGHLKVLWIFQLCIPIDHALIISFINRLSNWQTIEGGSLKLSFCTSTDDWVSFFRFLLIVVVLAGIHKFLIIYFCILAVIDPTPHFRLCSTYLLFILLKILRLEKLALFRRCWVISLEFIRCYGRCLLILLWISGDDVSCQAAKSCAILLKFLIAVSGNFESIFFLLTSFRLL